MFHQGNKMISRQKMPHHGSKKYQGRKCFITVAHWNLNITKGQGTGIFVRCNDVSLYQGLFSYICLSLGLKISFVIEFPL